MQSWYRKRPTHQYRCENHECLSVTPTQDVTKSETCTDKESSWCSHFKVRQNLISVSLWFDEYHYFLAFISRHVRTIAKHDHLLRYVRPSVHMEQLGSHWMDFHEIWYLSIFPKSVEKIQVPLKSVKNNGYLTRRPLYRVRQKNLTVFKSHYIGNRMGQGKPTKVSGQLVSCHFSSHGAVDRATSCFRC